MKHRPIHYEPHPVSRERKAELKAMGVNIVDAKFAPPAARQQSTAPKAKARKSQSEPQGVS